MIPDPDNRLFPIQWLDDEHLVMGYSNIESGVDQLYVLSSTVVMNVYNNELQKFIPDYPDMEGYYDIPSWGVYTDTRIVISPSLTHLVYSADDDGGLHLVLWDISLGKEIARIHNLYSNSGIRNGAPWWSPDGDKFITSAPPQFIGYDDQLYVNYDTDLPYIDGDELISMSKEGEIQRLTFLTASHIVRQKDFIWSPDGQKVAFALRIQDGDDWSDWQFSVLDIPSGIVTNYCIESGYRFIWSPDSKKIIVHTPPLSWKPNEYDVLLVDLENAIAVRIAEKAMASSWIAEQ